MALLSGEVETPWQAGSLARLRSLRFRMALLSGEVETQAPCNACRVNSAAFRMALLSGEVETPRLRRESAMLA